MLRCQQNTEVVSIKLKAARPGTIHCYGVWWRLKRLTGRIYLVVRYSVVRYRQ